MFFFYCFGGILEVSLKVRFPVSLSSQVGFDCSTVALTAPQMVLSIPELVELKMLDFSDRTRTCISILTSAASQCYIVRFRNSKKHFYMVDLR